MGNNTKIKVRLKIFGRSRYVYMSVITVVLLSAVMFCILIVGTLVSNYSDFSFDENKTDVSFYENPLCVSFIDVGQGDCSLISCNGVNVLVDGGEQQYAESVIDYLENIGIDYIDCYVLSHPHSDHIGASADIIEAFDIGQVFTTSFSEFNIPTSRVYENTLIAMDKSGADVVFVEAGDSYTLGDLELNIIAPIEETSEYNDMSIVFTAEYKDTTVLFTGDATVNVEKQILEQGFNVDADVLKIAHHGSTTSSSEAFIDAVSPYFAVISCGEGNSYGHPHWETIELLKNKGIKYQRTDEGGTVIYYGDGKTMFTEVLG